MKKIILLCVVSMPLWGWGNWDGEGYAKNLSPGKKDGFAVVSRIEQAEKILDVGCGDGGITAQLAEKFSTSQVMGIDLSTSMIGYARRTYGMLPNLSFQVQDARFLMAEEEFDLILSLATMHWIKEQKEVLNAFQRALKPEGKLLIQMPLQLPSFFHDALQQVLTDSFWAVYFEGYEAPWTFYHLGEYLFFLHDAGLIPFDMRIFIAEEVYPSKRAFHENLLQWLPFLQQVPEELKDLFLMQLIDNYLVLSPEDEKGQIIFAEPLLEIICNKLNY